MDPTIIATIVFGFASVTLMGWQLVVIYRQLSIMKKQDELLARRAQLSVVADATGPTATDQNVRIRVQVKNTGTKSAANFYWHLLVPVAFSANQRFSSYKGDVDPLDTTAIGGAQFRRFRELAEVPVYPTRSVFIGSIARDNPQVTGQVVLHWKVVSEDGAFPPGDNMVGSITVDLAAGAAPQESAG